MGIIVFEAGELAMYFAVSVDAEAAFVGEVIALGPVFGGAGFAGVTLAALGEGCGEAEEFARVRVRVAFVVGFWFRRRVCHLWMADAIGEEIALKCCIIDDIQDCEIVYPMVFIVS